MAQQNLFAPEISDERLDELIVEAAKRAGHCVIMAGAEVRGHCGTHHQTNTVIKLGMDQYEPRHLRKMFRQFMEISQ